MSLDIIMNDFKYRDNPAERLGYLRGGLSDIKCHR